MTRKLQEAVQKQKKATKKHVPQIYGMLGIPIGGAKTVEVPNRKSYVYVRLRNNQSEVIQAFNNQVSPAYNLPVIVERQGGRYTVIGVDTQRYENNWQSFSPYLPRHGNTHSFDSESGGGGDIVFVHSRQFMPGLVFPSGSIGGPNVVVSPYLLKRDNNTWLYTGNTGTPDITQYRPSSPTGAVMVLVYLDSVSGNYGLIVGSGTVFPSSLTGTSQIAPFIPALSDPTTQIPLAAVRLVTGTSQIVWNNLYDARQFLHTVPTGTGGGGASTGSTTITVWDEGIPLGTPSIFNFVGTGVTATISGSVVRVDVPGGASNLTGTSIGLPNAAVLTDSNGFLLAAPWLRWGTSNREFLEFGANVAGKESNAGKMGYEAIGAGYFDIVGAGTSAGDRWVRIFDNLDVDNLMRPNGAQFKSSTLFNTFPYLNATGVMQNAASAPNKSLPTGTDYVLGLDSANGNRGVIIYLADIMANLATPFDGWIICAETWTRTGNHTFTVVGDRTTKYRKGAKIRYVDGSNEYGVIGSSSHAAGVTTVNLIPNTDYAMSSSPLSKDISYIELPEGWPDYFNFTPTIASTVGTITSYSIGTAKWKAVGTTLFEDYLFTITNNGTGATAISVDLAAALVGVANGVGKNASTGAQIAGAAASGSAIVVTRYDGAYPAATGNQLRLSVAHEF